MLIVSVYSSGCATSASPETDDAFVEPFKKDAFSEDVSESLQSFGTESDSKIDSPVDSGFYSSAIDPDAGLDSSIIETVAMDAQEEPPLEDSLFDAGMNAAPSIDSARPIDSGRGNDAYIVPLDCPDVQTDWDEEDTSVGRTETHIIEVTPHEFFRITTVDDATSLPIAGVHIETVNKISLTTDANGNVAFYEPGLMQHEVFFYVSHPNYEVPKDYFNIQGVSLFPEEGDSAEIRMTHIDSVDPPMVETDLQTRLLEGTVVGPSQCFGIEIIDSQTARGVPLVRLTTGEEEFWTDSNGVIAFCNPDKVGEQVQFEVFSHGYQLPGGDDLLIQTAAGKSVVIEIDRINIAERLYRVTGQGIYRDSVLLGRKVPLAQPVINGRVMGQDSVQAAVYHDELFLVWGDTQRPSYPLGNFHCSAAVADLPRNGGLHPSFGVDALYFVDASGFSKEMVPPEAPPVNKPTWILSLFVMSDKEGVEKLMGVYAVVAKDFVIDELGIVEFNDLSQRFIKIMQYPIEGTDDDLTFLYPTGHNLQVSHGETEYIYYQNPIRIPASKEALLDPSQYQTFTAFAQGSNSEFVREADGTLLYQFKEGTDYVKMDDLEAEGIGVEQALEGHMRDPDIGVPIIDHSHCTKSFNPYRNRYIKIVQEVGGESSFLGEIWLTEGDTPMGPWIYSRKIITHDHYTFYNPYHHPHYDQDGGRIIYFEGTYSQTFSSGIWPPTPRYDYNQIMYRVDLSDSRLVLPVAVYDLSKEKLGDFSIKQDLPLSVPRMRAAFYAPDRPAPGLSKVGWSTARCANPHLILDDPRSLSPPLFYAIPHGSESIPVYALPLYEYVSNDSRYRYSMQESLPLEEFVRKPEPVVWVWPNPQRVKYPVGDYLGDLVAVAGDDQCVTVETPDARTRVTFQGTGSRAFRGSIVDYVWEAPTAYGCQTALGVQVQFTFPVGTHFIKLSITDDQGNRDTDTVVVEVAEAVDS